MSDCQFCGQPVDFQDRCLYGGAALRCDRWKEAKVSEEQSMWRDPRPRGDREAFPTGDPTNGGQAGMTLREYYAGLAMQGLLAGRHIVSDSLERVDETAVFLADALLAELERTRG